MSRYDLIAIDMDGTMLTSQKVVSPRVAEALQAARDAGKLVVVASGRGISELTVYEEVAKTARFAVAANGALEYDFVARETLAQTPLCPEAVEMALDAAARYDTMLQVYVDGNPHVSPADAGRMGHWHMEAYQEQFKTTTTKVDSPASFARTHRHELGKLIAYFTTAHERQVVHDALMAARIPANMLFSETTSLEFMAPGVTKGLGLSRLCDKVGVPFSRVIAVGDAYNDLEMLEQAGLGIAMGNANDAARAAADAQVADNDHDGVAEAIEKYLLA